MTDEVASVGRSAHHRPHYPQTVALLSRRPTTRGRRGRHIHAPRPKLTPPSTSTPASQNTKRLEGEMGDVIAIKPKRKAFPASAERDERLGADGRRMPTPNSTTKHHKCSAPAIRHSRESPKRGGERTRTHPSQALRLRREGSQRLRGKSAVSARRTRGKTQHVSSRERQGEEKEDSTSSTERQDATPQSSFRKRQARRGGTSKPKGKGGRRR
ncbi:hypothetical protein B0H14DRAFT_2675209 [Mycena olivaceomarginata]|nr:hypothetical protein B0H14DRAFT_2675209 [Mycena olivaceomarginata]